LALVQQHGKHIQEITLSAGPLINDKNASTLSLIMPGSSSFRRLFNHASPRHLIDIIRKVLSDLGTVNIDFAG
jgi:hypothetical protein